MTRLASRRASRALLLVSALGCVSLAGCRAGDDAPAAERPTADATTRHVPLDGQPNFRDVGGYRTEDGRTVRRGVVYRSGELPRLSDADVATIEALEVRTVVNFLTPTELARRGEDRLPDGVDRVMLPIDTDDGLATSIVEARRTGDFSAVPVDLNPRLHAMLVDEARDEYAALFRSIIVDDARPIVFHCSHGVHRTGTATAILLWTLGVPWETIREDYLLSKTLRAEEVERRLGELRALAARNQGIPVDQVDDTNMTAFYVLEGTYIDGTRDRILAEYGSIDAYLRDGLGLRSDEISALRDALLE